MEQVHTNLTLDNLGSGFGDIISSDVWLDVECSILGVVWGQVENLIDDPVYLQIFSELEGRETSLI